MMSLQHGILGLLTYSDSTGYELSKLFEGSLNFFWSAQRSQIYRELDRMEKTGWVSSQVVVQEGRPNKRLYSVTADGREEFSQWLSDFKYKPESSHTAIVMRIFFGAETEPEKTIELLEEFRSQCVEEMEALQTVAAQNVELFAEAVPGGELKKAYWNITLDAGFTHMQAVVGWAEKSIEALKGMR